MKRLFLSFLVTALAFFMSGKTSFANEGVLNLRGIGGASCFAASVYVDGAYRILMTCRELKSALAPEKNRFVAWVEAEEDAKQKRLGEIVNGKMSVVTDVKFSRIFVTLEVDGYGNEPSSDVLLVGSVAPIDFGTAISAPVTISLTPTPTDEVKTTPTKKTSTPKPTKASDDGDTSGLGSALSVVFKIALFGFGLLLLIVGVFSFLQRRRSL